MTIQAAELTQALATGAVSAFMTSGATGFDSKVWEQVKYYYDVRAWLPKNLVIVSKKAFDALDTPTLPPGASTGATVARLLVRDAKTVLAELRKLVIE